MVKLLTPDEVLQIKMPGSHFVKKKRWMRQLQQFQSEYSIIGPTANRASDPLRPNAAAIMVPCTLPYVLHELRYENKTTGMIRLRTLFSYCVGENDT